ncbi:AsnC family transcriptional regulator [Sphingobium sp. SYK-6]|uniref:Lrp/AsnC family transcriptional regulator n=1 Tax=Sphingobium sp. (strain NBRC 103272 / SYK-6) TaxID=627192 RepID=UPI0002277697|nr:Lrp/AsnC family transcriptional regulator [Sphingobium sp. SYK-6]BAK67247.1 AsnC family transcriptional regulator [Sphingobium sp. SYK-6]
MKKIVKLDELDRRIVSELQQDGGLSNAELAERVGSTGPSCWRRVRQLEETGVLRATVRLADPRLLGHGVNVLCNVRLRNHDPETSRRFIDFIDSEARIMECYSMSGEWDYLMRVVASDVADYEDFLLHRLLTHPVVANAASHFALSIAKYKTALPIFTEH